jgi:type III secretion protein HrpB1
VGLVAFGSYGTPASEVLMPNILAFRTPVGGVTVPILESLQFGAVDVSKFDRIRIVAQGSNNISLILQITEDSLLSPFDDALSLAPHGNLTRVYDIVCTKLTLFALAGPIEGLGNSNFDFLLYGFHHH